MARNYSVVGNATNTASSTLPLFMIVGAATIRPALYDILLGSDATPADNAAKYTFQRSTTAGTPGSSFTPIALDPADPAALASAGIAVYTSTAPALTANAFVLSVALNQRATFRWVAAPGSELKIPATASNGLACMPLVVAGSAVNTAFTVLYSE